MSARQWDIGDQDPGPDVDEVFSLEFTDDDCQPWRFGRTYQPDEWKGYIGGGKVYYPWAELVRRFGPVREAQ